MAILGCAVVNYRSRRPGGKVSPWIEPSKRLLLLARIVTKARHWKTHLQQRERTQLLGLLNDAISQLGS